MNIHEAIFQRASGVMEPVIDILQTVFGVTLADRDQPPSLYGVSVSLCFPTTDASWSSERACVRYGAEALVAVSPARRSIPVLLAASDGRAAPPAARRSTSIDTGASTVCKDCFWMITVVRSGSNLSRRNGPLTVRYLCHGEVDGPARLYTKRTSRQAGTNACKLAHRNVRS
jgi:hypothetical protein